MSFSMLSLERSTEQAQDREKLHESSEGRGVERAGLPTGREDGLKSKNPPWGGCSSAFGKGWG